MMGALTVENATGAPIPFIACQVFFQATLSNERAQQEGGFPRCGVPYTLPRGTSTFHLSVTSRHTSCSNEPTSTTTIRCSANGQMPPLPAGDYQLQVAADGLPVQLPKPVTVHVTPEQERPSGVATVKLEVVSPIVTAGSSVDAAVAVDNGTEDWLELTGCGSPFLVELANRETQQGSVANLCLRYFPHPAGVSRSVVKITTSYGGCVGDPAFSVGAGPHCLVSEGVPPLPVATYRASVSGNGQLIERPKPVTIYVVAESCATDVMTVEVPNVVGKRLAGARRAIETTGLQFVSFDGYRTDDAGNRARVTAQLPRAGAIVSRGSCMGLRAR